jgi:hypothetical protein
VGEVVGKEGRSEGVNPSPKRRNNETRQGLAKPRKYQSLHTYAEFSGVYISLCSFNV